MHFDGRDNAARFTTTLQISPEQIDIGGILLDNRWPEADPMGHIADEDGPQEPGLLSDIAHGVLDVVGLVPVVGELADGANALFYLAEGNKTDAALSAAAMIPVAGWAATGAKVVRKGVKIAERAQAIKKVTDKINRAATAAKAAVKRVEKGASHALDLTEKPKHSPDVKKWQAKGGKVETLPDGSWKYTNKDGISVNYKNGYPDFKPHARQQVDIKVEGNHTTDFTKADKAAPLGSKLSSSTWHHHENMRTMQEVPRKIHRQFTHAGGVAKVKKKGVSVKIKKK